MVLLTTFRLLSTKQKIFKQLKYNHCLKRQITILQKNKNKITTQTKKNPTPYPLNCLCEVTNLLRVQKSRIWAFFAYFSYSLSAFRLICQKQASVSHLAHLRAWNIHQLVWGPLRHCSVAGKLTPSLQSSILLCSTSPYHRTAPSYSKRNSYYR